MQKWKEMPTSLHMASARNETLLKYSTLWASVLIKSQFMARTQEITLILQNPFSSVVATSELSPVANDYICSCWECDWADEC